MIHNFHKQKLTEIKWWAWTATVLPLTSLAALFFAWIFGLETFYNKMLVIGATSMFGVAVLWWWWALWTIAGVTRMLGKTISSLKAVKTELNHLKNDVLKNE